MNRSSTGSAPPIIRLAHPLAFVSFLDHIGAPTEGHFRRLGLPTLCEDPDAFVPLTKAWAFFDAATLNVDPMLGWHVGKFIGDHNLNSGFLRKLENAPTLYQALKRFIRLASAEASHLQLGILERRHDILFHTHYSNMKEVTGYLASQAYQLEVYLDLVRHFVGKNWVPNEIGIEYPVVPRVVEEHFPGSRVLTSQQVGYISIPRSCLHTAARSREPDRNDDSLVLTRDLEFDEVLGALLEPHLPAGYPSARIAASLMDTSVRTLARRLAESGSTYRAVVDDVRFKVAKELLQDPHLSISDIATAVGFGDAAHFTRMFRRMAGLTPRQYRQAIQA